MPSGQFHSILLDDIRVDRNERQRREIKGIDDLSDSIQRLGLINPILVRREDLALVAGERRLSACRALGWTHIPCQYEDEVEPSALRLLELEENTKRLDLPWADQARAIGEYHTLRSSEPGWTQAATAKALGMSQPGVAQYLQVVKAMNQPAVAQAPKYSTALGLVKRAEERKVGAEVAALAGNDISTVDTAIQVADFNTWAPAYAGQPFNLLHCDFPYGINTDKRQQGTAHLIEGAYADTPETYFSLMKTLIENVDRLCDSQCHLMFWFSMEFYNETLTYLSEAFEVQRFPLIWTKPDNVGLLPDPQRGPRRTYETAFLASRGDRKIVRAVSNHFSLGVHKGGHISEKPQLMLEHFFRMLVDDSTRLFDPTAGSGSSLRAGRACSASSVLGLEVNPEYAAEANERYTLFSSSLA
jgi:ParB/RepB/Spo0J family partition protein